MRFARFLGAALLAGALGPGAGHCSAAAAPTPDDVRAARVPVPDKVAVDERTDDAAAADALVPDELTSGMPLRAALEVLRQRGLELVYANTLVPAQVRITGVPAQGLALEEQAAELLEPFGLELEHGSGELWYVVRTRSERASDSDPGGVPTRSPTPVQESTARPPLVEEVVVVSSRYRLVRDLHEGRRLEQQELASIPSIGRDVLRAVAQLPGVASSGVGARGYVRGGNANEVLYRVAGAALIEPFHMGEFHALFSVVNPDLVDTLSLFSAGFPASLGSRLSGVVDIELKQPERDLQGGINVNVIDAALHVEGREGPVEWLASARRSTLDQLMRYLERDYGEPRFHDELLQMHWEGSRSAVTTGLLASNDELELRDPGAGERAQSDFHNLVFWNRLEFAPRDTVDLELMSTWTQVENARDGTLDNPVDAVGALSEEREFTVVVLEPSARVRLTDAAVLHAGLGLQHQSGEFDVDLRAGYGVLGEPLQPMPVLARTTTSDREGNLISAYASIQQDVTERLQIEYGLRHDYQDNDPVHDRETSPRLQARLRVDPELDLFANLGRYAQHQNLYELQLDDGLLELQAPQVAEQLSAGAYWHPGARLAMRMEAYARRVEDPWRHFENLYNRWVLLPELHADRVALVPEKVRAYGLELSVRFDQDAAFGWFGSYSGARTEERLDRAWQPRPWDQTHSVRAGMNWHPADWQIDVMAAWHSGWATNARFEGPSADPATFYGERLSDYFSLDLHLARRFRLERSVVEVYADISNVTSRENVGGEKFVQSATGPMGRDRDLLQPIPAIGISWKW